MMDENVDVLFCSLVLQVLSVLLECTPWVYSLGVLTTASIDCTPSIECTDCTASIDCTDCSPSIERQRKSDKGLKSGHEQVINFIVSYWKEERKGEKSGLRGTDTIRNNELERQKKKTMNRRKEQKPQMTSDLCDRRPGGCFCCDTLISVFTADRADN